MSLPTKNTITSPPGFQVTHQEPLKTTASFARRSCKVPEPVNEDRKKETTFTSHSNTTPCSSNESQQQILSRKPSPTTEAPVFHKPETISLEQVNTDLTHLKQIFENESADSSKQPNEQIIRLINTALDEIDLIDKEDRSCVNPSRIAKSIGYPILALFATINLFGVTSILDKNGSINTGQLFLRLGAALSPAAIYVGSADQVFSKVANWVKNTFSASESATSSQNSDAKQCRNTSQKIAVITTGLTYSALTVVLDTKNAKSGSYNIFSVMGASAQTAEGLSTATGALNGLAEGWMPLVCMPELIQQVITPFKSWYRGSYHSEEALREAAGLLEQHCKQSDQSTTSFIKTLTPPQREQYQQILTKIKNSQTFRHEFENFIQNQPLNNVLKVRIASTSQIIVQTAIPIFTAYLFGYAFSASQKLSFYNDQINALNNTTNATELQLTPYPTFNGLLDTGSYAAQGIALSAYTLECINVVYKAITGQLHLPDTRLDAAKTLISLLISGIGVGCYSAIGVGAAEVLREVIDIEALAGISTILAPDIIEFLGTGFDTVLIMLLISVLLPPTYNAAHNLLGHAFQLCDNKEPSATITELDEDAIETGLLSSERNNMAIIP